MALAKAEIEFDDNDKITKLIINDTDLTDAAFDKKVVIEEGSKRIIKLELACESLIIKKKGDNQNESGDTPATNKF